MPVPDGGGGPYLVVFGPGNLGTQIVGTALTGHITLRAIRGVIGDTVRWTLVSNSNPDFVIGPPINGDVAIGTPDSIPVTITEAVAGVYATNVVIRDVDNITDHPFTITASFVVAGAQLTATPPNFTFPSGIVTDPLQTTVVVIGNTTGANITVTAVNMKGLPFTCLTATPFIVPNGGTFNITLQATYDFAGIFTGSATLKSILADLVIPLYVTSLFLNSVVVLANKTRTIMLGFNSPINIETFDTSSFDFGVDCVLIFNGALWNNPGVEKTLRRLEVFYENVGVCTGLKLDISVWRPSLTPPAFDVAPSNQITIGDVSADLSERSAFFDVNLSGEIIIAKLTRLASTGPVSLLGFTPHFEDRGEKVENV